MKGTRHDFLWDGDVIASEAITQADGGGQTIDWHFEPDSFVPIARKEGAYLSYVVTDHLGTPKEIVGETGHLEWAAEYRTWGEIKRFEGHAPKSRPKSQTERDQWGFIPLEADGNTALQHAEKPNETYCPIRFQGQWEDTETRLFYNRFRYYDAQNQYLSRDPIGLLGGFRLFGYVEAASKNIDPYGLYGVYIFKVLPGAKRNIGKCYVGRGDSKRFDSSRKYRSGEKCIVKARKVTQGQLYNTDAAAIRAGVDPLTFGKLVENRLIAPVADGGFGAKLRSAWLNAKFDGQSAWKGASDKAKREATKEAALIKSLTSAQSGCR